MTQGPETPQVHRPDLVEAFNQALYALRLRAGNPAIKSLVAPLKVSRNTASLIVNGRRLPTRPQLLALIEKLDVPRSDLSDRLVQLWEEVHGLVPARLPGPRSDSPDEKVPTTYYDSTTAFYSALEVAILEARSLVRVTYIRQSPPSRYANAAATSYFDRLISWADDAKLPVNRVIGVPVGAGGPSTEFVAWLREHRARTCEVPTYESKIVPWSVSADAINMALIDDERAFLTFSGINTQILHGMQVESKRFVSRLNEYFNQLWLPAVPLDTYLGGLGSAP